MTPPRSNGRTLWVMVGLQFIMTGAFSMLTGLANVIAAPFLGNRSDRIGYRRVLLICLCGATLTTLPQAFTENYWVFTAERFGVGLFIGGLLPTANALVGRLVPRAERGTIYASPRQRPSSATRCAR